MCSYQLRLCQCVGEMRSPGRQVNFHWVCLTLLLQSSVVLRFLKQMRRRSKRFGNNWLWRSSQRPLQVFSNLIWNCISSVTFWLTYCLKNVAYCYEGSGNLLSCFIWCASLYSWGERERETAWHRLVAEYGLHFEKTVWSLIVVSLLYVIMD